jgi:hypothetical protein
MTRYSTLQEFRWEDYITRWEAAKFLSTFAENEGVNFTSLAECWLFTDLTSYDRTLVPYIQKACEYWLIKWHNNMYMPEKSLTEAEAATIIIRSMRWWDGINETLSPRRLNAYNIWVAEWLRSNHHFSADEMDVPITREKLWLRLFRANLLRTLKWHEIEKSETSTVLTWLDTIHNTESISYKLESRDICAIKKTEGKPTYQQACNHTTIQEGILSKDDLQDKTLTLDTQWLEKETTRLTLCYYDESWLHRDLLRRNNACIPWWILY